VIKQRDPVSTSPSSTNARLFKRGFSAVFASTFVTIFLAEIGDKTQLATLLITAESRSPIVVFLGAALALIATSLIGVLLGQWLAKRLSPQRLEVIIAGLLLIIAVLLLGDVVEGV
jgi:putative Ca2+/H+ antiporter (TMEM165/GDT1 family)